MLRLHGIPNCETVKKARAWLAGRGCDHEFADFRKQPPTPELLAAWEAQVGWETLLNRRGTTWRQLPEDRREAVRDAASAIAVMLEKPSAIKRPVAVIDGRVLAVGFDAAIYERLFAPPAA